MKKTYLAVCGSFHDSLKGPESDALANPGEHLNPQQLRQLQGGKKFTINAPIVHLSENGIRFVRSSWSLYSGGWRLGGHIELRDPDGAWCHACIRRTVGSGGKKALTQAQVLLSCKPLHQSPGAGTQPSMEHAAFLVQAEPETVCVGQEVARAAVHSPVLTEGRRVAVYREGRIRFAYICRTWVCHCLQTPSMEFRQRWLLFAALETLPGVRWVNI